MKWCVKTGYLLREFLVVDCVECCRQVLIRHSWPRDSARAPADRVRSRRNAALIWVQSNLMAWLSMWKLVNISELLFILRLMSLRSQYWDPSCSPSMPVQLLMSLQATESSTTSMLKTGNLALQCAPTTHPPDCLFLPRILPMSNNGTCRTACSSTWTNEKHWLSEWHKSYMLRHQPCHPSLSPTSTYH